MHSPGDVVSFEKKKIQKSPKFDRFTAKRKLTIFSDDQKAVKFRPIFFSPNEHAKGQD